MLACLITTLCARHKVADSVSAGIADVSSRALQVFILDALSDYTPKDGKEAEETIERVTPRLQHANCAVVLSAVKVRGAVQHSQLSYSLRRTAPYLKPQ